jgi:hypothetical protein
LGTGMRFSSSGVLEDSMIIARIDVRLGPPDFMSWIGSGPFNIVQVRMNAITLRK